MFNINYQISEIFFILLISDLSPLMGRRDSLCAFND